MRGLPSVDRVLQQVASELPHWLVVQVIRREIQTLRAALQNGRQLDAEQLWEMLLAAVRGRLESLLGPGLREVINATGVVLHTNLGRAPLPAAACKAMAETAGYVNLELDLADGERSSRLNHVRELLCLLTGAEAALVVNNNAAAVLLVLSVLAAGKEVIVSRGQLVEIGGSFRLPDIMRAGGAQLVEVGTTNHTRPSDYEMAIGADTALLLRVHPSNFTITGYTGEVDLATLVGIGRRHGIPVMEDLGSGLMVDFPGADLTLPAAIAAGAAIVTASGDKMLGGPQAGLLLGRAELIEPLAKSPLFRAMRLDKTRLAALEATLRLYLEPETAWREIPALSMLARPPAELAKQARSLARRLKRHLDVPVTVCASRAPVGGGSLPGLELPTSLVALTVATAGQAQALVDALRVGNPPVLARARGEQVLFDIRTVISSQHTPLVAACRAALEVAQCDVS
ncbi:MAG TPA: L-seryl-tRNA(Sec) selenium transferase [Firmicutes bacterium]|nr:L-seryl-tRNA(Sec) selenium transferase [Bacillota bacterium]